MRFGGGYPTVEQVGNDIPDLDERLRRSVQLLRRARRRQCAPKRGKRSERGTRGSSVAARDGGVVVRQRLASEGAQALRYSGRFLPAAVYGLVGFCGFNILVWWGLAFTRPDVEVARCEKRLGDDDL